MPQKWNIGSIWNFWFKNNFDYITRFINETIKIKHLENDLKLILFVLYIVNYANSKEIYCNPQIKCNFCCNKLQLSAMVIMKQLSAMSRVITTEPLKLKGLCHCVKQH